MDESEDTSYEDGFPGPPDLTPSLLQFTIGGMGRNNGVTWSVDEQVLKVQMADGSSTEVEVTPSPVEDVLVRRRTARGLDLACSV